MKDLTGQRFGRLVAIEPTEKRLRGQVVWRCKCECGNEAEVASSALVSGRTRSCGCLWQEGGGRTRYKDLAGRRFGKLTVIRPSGRLNGSVVWECRCDCGNVANVASYLLTGGKTRSCGCLRGEVQKKRGRMNDLAGQRFGMLVAEEHVGSRYRYAVWRCRCDCGREIEVVSRDLVSGKVADCGCQQRRRATSVRAGRHFGKLIAVDATGEKAENSPIWRCLCECNRTVLASAADLLGGSVTSCGHCD